ncbi:MAG: very short patch repair endonuclease [Novosphingobium sp.]
MPTDKSGDGRRDATAPDPLTPEQRRRNMARIRARDTLPEMLLRRALHRAGHRYRLYARDLPGRPDLVFRRRRAVIFVHGCFWHGHTCPKGVTPATRRDFWVAKLEANRRRDSQQIDLLLKNGWRAAVVWECALVGRARLPMPAVIEALEIWLSGDGSRFELSGDWSPTGSLDSARSA